MFDEIIDTFVLKSDGIDHARRSLCQTWIGIALTWMESRTLDNESAKSIEVDEVAELYSVAESAGCSEYWILEFKTSYIGCKICHN